MMRVMHGKIRGRTIELSEDTGLAEGQEVEIQVTPTQTSATWGEGLKRCAGALADDAEWDGVMDEIHRARKLERRPLAEHE